jgi:hypothetical protein
MRRYFEKKKPITHPSCSALRGAPWIPTRPQARSALPTAEQTAKPNDTWSKLFSTERCALVPNSSSSSTQRHPDGRADGKAQRHLVQAVQRCKVLPGTQLVLKHAAPSRQQSRRQSTTTPGRCSALRGAPWIPTRPQARSALPTAEQTAKHNDTSSKLFSTARCSLAPNSSSSSTQRHPDGRADGRAQRHLVQAVQH